MKDSLSIKLRLERAIMTLRSLPADKKTRPMGHISAWPDMIRPAKNGAILHRDSDRFMPNSHDITDCYNIIDHLYEMSEFQRKLIWARAMKVPWQALMMRHNRSRTHLNRLYLRALSELEKRL